MSMDNLLTPELNRALTAMFVRMKRDTRDVAETEANRALKPLVTGGGTSISPFAGGDRNLVFTQAAPSATWNIAHNFNKFPSVKVLDTGGIEIEGQITHTDVNNLVVAFNTAIAGTAVLN